MVPSSSYKFVEWLPVSGDPQFLEECLVLKTFPNQEKAFINLKCLDKIDLGRIKTYITSNQARLHEDLASLLAEQYMGNGCNGLSYFHQLSKILSPSGVVRSAASNQILVTPKTMQQPLENSQQSQVSQSSEEIVPSFESVATAKPSNVKK